jgi:hypothetical protein
MQHNIVTRVVVLCLVSLVGGGLAAMPSSATAATGTWVSPAWMAQGKYGGILKLVTNADPTTGTSTSRAAIPALVPLAICLTPW